MNHYYDEVHSSLAALLSTALKGNEYLKKALLTGIQRIAKENIFSGLNNIAVYGVDKQLYSEFFGLTKEETMELLSYYDIPLYDGYRIGLHDIYTIGGQCPIHGLSLTMPKNKFSHPTGSIQVRTK